ncbi:MAG: class I SAM-dependent methyltransferase [Gammaproteobacteria bacterium]
MVAARQLAKRLLRESGLLGTVDRLLYISSLARLRGSNGRFVAANPGFSLPPKWLAFDAYSAPDWAFYKESGLETAAYLAEVSKQYSQSRGPLNVLEWGCGPGRVIRHIKDAFRQNGRAEVYGSDYNEATIDWCRKNIPGVSFVLNPLLPDPPLPFNDTFFGFIYSISVFTHLSESASERWMRELGRLAQPGAVLVITTNGDSWQSKMLPDELRSYREKGVVTRDKVQEGKKMFSACHSPEYLRQELFRGLQVLSHLPASFPHTGQDCWILRK